MISISESSAHEWRPKASGQTSSTIFRPRAEVLPQRLRRLGPEAMASVCLAAGPKEPTDPDDGFGGAPGGTARRLGRRHGHHGPGGDQQYFSAQRSMRGSHMLPKFRLPPTRLAKWEAWESNYCMEHAASLPLHQSGGTSHRSSTRRLARTSNDTLACSSPRISDILVWNRVWSQMVECSRGRIHQAGRAGASVDCTGFCRAVRPHCTLPVCRAKVALGKARSASSVNGLPAHFRSRDLWKFADPVVQ